MPQNLIHLIITIWSINNNTSLYILVKTSCDYAKYLDKYCRLIYMSNAVLEYVCRYNDETLMRVSYRSYSASLRKYGRTNRARTI